MKLALGAEWTNVVNGWTASTLRRNISMTDIWRHRNGHHYHFKEYRTLCRLNVSHRLAWERRRYFATSLLVLPRNDVCRTSASVWNFCACSSVLILRKNHWWRGKMTAVFSGYCRSMKGLVSKETVVLRRLGSQIRRFGFCNWVDNVVLVNVKDREANVTPWRTSDVVCLAVWAELLKAWLTLTIG